MIEQRNPVVEKRWPAVYTHPLTYSEEAVLEGSTVGGFVEQRRGHDMVGYRELRRVPVMIAEEITTSRRNTVRGRDGPRPA